MVAQIKENGIIYTGFNPNDNGKWLQSISHHGSHATLIYQADSFTQALAGYVDLQEDGRYKTHCLGNFESNFKDRYVNYFDTIDEGLEYLFSCVKEEVEKTYMK